MIIVATWFLITIQANENYDTLLMNRAQSLGADATAAGTKMFNGNGKRLAKVQL